MVRPVVHSIKHYVQKSIVTVVASTVNVTTLVKAVKVLSVNLVNEVVEGTIIKAVYLEYWIRAGDTAPASGVVALYKKSSDTSDPSTTEMAALGDWDNKKNVLFVQQGLYNDQDADAIAVVRQWFKIPKGKQRFGLGDELNLAVFAQGAIDQHICGFAVYKEYS